MATKKKTQTSKPSNLSMAAAKTMLAPLHDLLITSVKQNELNAQMLADLTSRVEKLAGHLDLLQKIAPDPKLLLEPAPTSAPFSLLTESP